MKQHSGYVVIFQHMHHSHKTPGVLWGPDDDPRRVETCRPMKVDNKEENGAYVGKITTYIYKKCTECHTLKNTVGVSLSISLSLSLSLTHTHTHTQQFASVALIFHDDSVFWFPMLKIWVVCRRFERTHRVHLQRQRSLRICRRQVPSKRRK